MISKCEYEGFYVRNIYMQSMEIKCFPSFCNCLVYFYCCQSTAYICIIHSCFSFYLLFFSSVFSRCVCVFKSLSLAHHCSSFTVLQCNIVFSCSNGANSLAIFRVKLWGSWVLNSYSCQHRRTKAFSNNSDFQNHTETLKRARAHFIQPYIFTYSWTHLLLSMLCGLEYSR